jgi:predicted class III extradiol MEMO1 family dioxygenase
VLDAAKADYAIITQHNAPVLPLVHPEHFQKKEDILVSYKRTLRTPLHAAWFFVKKWLPFLRPRHEN